jgi:hypothetical protein
VVVEPRERAEREREREFWFRSLWDEVFQGCAILVPFSRSMVLCDTSAVPIDRVQLQLIDFLEEKYPT